MAETQAAGGRDVQAHQNLPQPPHRPQRRDAAHRTRLRPRPARGQRRRQDDVPAPHHRPASSHRRLGQGLRQDHVAQRRRPSPPNRLHPHQSPVSPRDDADHLSRLHGPAFRPARRRAQAAPRLAHPGRRSARRLRPRHRRLLQRHDRPPRRRHQPHQRAGTPRLGRTDARPRPRGAPQHARPHQDAGPRENADRFQPQPQRHRRGLQPRGRPQPRPAHLLRLAPGPQGPDAPQPFRAGPRRRTEGVAKAPPPSAAWRISRSSISASAAWSCTSTTRSSTRPRWPASSPS